MFNKKQKAFTLVELIVVITILAILGTIAFISLQGYSESSRDSVRVSDISTMKTTLELYHLDAGKYPSPTNGVDITLSGSIVWAQGTFGDNLLTNLGNKLDKVPTDPLTNTQYTYSVTATRNKFQIGSLIEGDPIALGIYEKANAGDVEGIAFISGTYNGQATKSLTGSDCSMVNVPTIIANDIETTTDLQQLINSGSLVYNGYKNLPSSFKSSKFKYNGGFDFIPNILVSYTDNSSCTALIGTDPTPRLELMKGIQEAYSGTILSSEPEISKILSLVIDVNNPSEEAKNIAGSYVNNNLGGSVAVTASPIIGCITQPSYSGATFTLGTATLINQPWQSTNESEACYFTCGVGKVLVNNECVSESCSGTTPDGIIAIPNALNYAGGTWNYNTTAGLCTFICKENYNWNSTLNICEMEACAFDSSNFGECVFGL